MNDQARRLGGYVFLHLPEDEKSEFIELNNKFAEKEDSENIGDKLAFSTLSQIIELFSKSDYTNIGEIDPNEYDIDSEDRILSNAWCSTHTKDFNFFSTLYQIKSRHMKAFEAELERFQGTKVINWAEQLMDLIPPYPGRVQRAISWADKKIRKI